MNDEPLGRSEFQTGHSFESAPELGREFEETSSHEFPLEYDAADWEPLDNIDIEAPSEKHFELHYTPGGVLEQETHQDIDDAARQRILEAQREHAQEFLADEQELDFSDEFDHASRCDDTTARRHRAAFDRARRLERRTGRDRDDARERD